MSYLFTLFFAILTDAKLGRFKTIILGFILYVVGFALAIGFTYSTEQQPCDEQNKTNVSYEGTRIYKQNIIGIDIALIIM